MPVDASLLPIPSAVPTTFEKWDRHPSSFQQVEKIRNRVQPLVHRARKHLHDSCGCLCLLSTKKTAAGAGCYAMSKPSSVECGSCRQVPFPNPPLPSTRQGPHLCANLRNMTLNGPGHKIRFDHYSIRRAKTPVKVGVA